MDVSRDTIRKFYPYSEKRAGEGVSGYISSVLVTMDVASGLLYTARMRIVLA